MDIPGLHSWNLTPKEAIALQRKLQMKVVIDRPLDAASVGTVAGCDVSAEKHGRRVFAAVVVFGFPSLKVIEMATAEKDISFPYIPGLLAFRETPLLLDCFRSLKSAPAAVIVDGHGIAHPRGLGIASHLGLWLGVPTLGCAKTVLTGAYEEPDQQRGAASSLIDKTGVEIGRVLRTRDGVKPVFVSAGHLINLDSAAGLTLACTPRYRLPEPIRQAHRIANEVRTGSTV